MIETDIESSMTSSLSSVPHSAPSAMSEDETNSFSSIIKVDPTIDDWRFLSSLNGRSDFIVLNDTRGMKCCSLVSYYKVLGGENELLLKGKGLMNYPGAPHKIQVADLGRAPIFTITFKSVGCIPVLKRLEVKTMSKKRIGSIAENSNIFSLASFRICNEQEGSNFFVTSKINLWKGHDYEIRGSTDGNSKIIATVDRKGPAYSLKVASNSIVSCSNKALFISFCFFLDVKRRQFNG